MTQRQGPTGGSALPNWWERENQKRKVRVLIFLGIVLALIAFYYWVSALGVVGSVSGIQFNSAGYLAFVRQDASGNRALYAVRADGSDLRRLTAPDDISSKSNPAWTMDGRSLLYSSNRDNGSVTQLFLLGSGEPRQLTYGSGNKFNAVVSPVGGQAAFITQGAVKTVNLNGTEVYQILPTPRAGNSGSGDAAQIAHTMELPGPYLSAAFSSDGRGIAAVQDVSNDADVLPGLGIAPADQAAIAVPSGGSKPAILDTGHEVSVAWEPHGVRLACSFTELTATGGGGEQEAISGIRIWSFAPSGKLEGRAMPLFAGLGNSVEPAHVAWSPDGTKIAFEAWRKKPDGAREAAGLIVMPVTDHGVVVDPAHVKDVRYFVSASAAGAPQEPRWSPDGGRLAYELVRPDGLRDLCVVNSDGTNPVNLTHGVGDNMEAAWSPLK